MTYYTDQQIAEVSETIIVTRDFCGNEWEAANDKMAEMDIPKADRSRVYKVANYRANNRWNQCKRAAGVNEKYLW